jgi:hypothetical protein
MTRALVRPRVAEQPFTEQDDVQLWITSVVDDLDHQVSDAELARGSVRGSYLAVCGHVVLAASMTAPPARRCLACCAARLVESAVAPVVPDGDRRRARRGCNARHRWLVTRCLTATTTGGGAR